MEADWEVEIGGDAPVIDATWVGFVDLRRSPQLAFQLPEAANLSGLADALVRLNAAGSPVWTSKCDVWPVSDTEQLDPDEMGASDECLTHAWACYVDLLPRSDQQWFVLEMAVSWCRTLVERLHTVPLPCCRVDIVIRNAVTAAENLNVGVTAYFTGCGSSGEAAQVSLQSTLVKFADVLYGDSTVE